jgi:diguanylate cyclase (GGDEF)-like protein
MSPPRRSIFRSLSGRIVTLFLGLLLLVQLASFSAIRHSIDRNARATLTAELDVGERVLLRLLDQNAQKLSQGATLLAADYGFRTAVQSGDSDTLRSALDNQGARIGATVSALLDIDGKVQAVSGNGARALSPVLASLKGARRHSARTAGAAGTQLALVDGLPYQFVTVPMKAPLLVGWVVMGFPIDDALVKDLRALSGLQVAVLTQPAGGERRVAASTLPIGASGQLLGLRLGSEESLTLGQEAFEAHSKLLLHDDAGEIQAVLLRSVDEAVAPYRRLQGLLAGITGFGVLVFGIGSLLTARQVTRPVQALVQATLRLAQGDFDTPVPHTSRDDEIGDLASAFDRMREGIAEQQREIRRLAYWDTLTGLPNREQFRDALQAAVKACDDTLARAGFSPAQPATRLAVLMLDMDRIKHVNDLLGYHVGDQLLQGVAQRLRDEPACDGGLLARLPGDEFALLLPGADAGQALAVAQRILKAFEPPMRLADATIDISAGIGLACYPAHAADGDLLLSRAEVAMYEAKRRTSGPLLYDAAFDSGSSLTLSLLSEMRRAVDQGELRLFLQPKIGLVERRLLGAEALVRWQHPQRGLVPPMEFIPFAEQTGFIHHLTLWVMEDAARTWAELTALGLHLRLSVNLSTHDLLDPDLLERFGQLLDRHGTPPEAFCLEITESAIMGDPQRALQTLHALSARGFKLSIDDFGTGYSSLAYLKQLPVNELKIDKSFVMGMQTDVQDAKIVRSTIDLAHNMGLSVVAEGVENAAIIEQLAALSCDEVQGYHISKPLPLPGFIQWAQARRAAEAAALHVSPSAAGGPAAAHGSTVSAAA